MYTKNWSSVALPVSSFLCLRHLGVGLTAQEIFAQKKVMLVFCENIFSSTYCFRIDASYVAAFVPASGKGKASLPADLLKQCFWFLFVLFCFGGEGDGLYF